MAEPGDPKNRAAPAEDHDHDAHVGFVSPSSLAGRARVSEPEPFASQGREPDLFDPPEPGPFDRSEPTTRPTAPFVRRAQPAPTAAQVVHERFDRADAAYRPEIARRQGPAVPMRLYAVYVLILLAVPTLGVSCLAALLGVMGRDGAKTALEESHFVYQKRTVIGAIAAAVVGAILIVVNVGVLVLFALAIWVLARGAFGVLKLKSGQAVSNPRSWLF